MRKRKAFSVALVLLLAIAVSAPSCSDSSLRQASVVINDFANSLEKVQDAEIIAHNQGFVSQSDHVAIQATIENLATYGQSAVTAIRVQKSKVGAIAAIDSALVEIDKLLNKGLLGVKNEQSKAGLTALILAVRGTLTTAKALLT